MIIWGWIGLQLFVQLSVMLAFPNRVGKGRILTRPLWRFRLYRPYVSPHTGAVLASSTRSMQILTLTLPYIGLTFAQLRWGGGMRGGIVYSVVIIALYIDDYLTGDDDRWKRFKQRARNAVRWKMKIRQTAPDA